MRQTPLTSRLTSLTINIRSHNIVTATRYLASLKRQRINRFSTRMRHSLTNNSRSTQPQHTTRIISQSPRMHNNHNRSLHDNSLKTKIKKRRILRRRFNRQGISQLTVRKHRNHSSGRYALRFTSITKSTQYSRLRRLQQYRRALLNTLFTRSHSTNLRIK